MAHNGPYSFLKPSKWTDALTIIKYHSGILHEILAEVLILPAPFELIAYHILPYETKHKYSLFVVSVKWSRRLRQPMASRIPIPWKAEKLYLETTQSVSLTKWGFMSPRIFFSRAHTLCTFVTHYCNKYMSCFCTQIKTIGPWKLFSSLAYFNIHTGMPACKRSPLCSYWQLTGIDLWPVLKHTAMLSMVHCLTSFTVVSRFTEAYTKSYGVRWYRVDGVI